MGCAVRQVWPGYFIVDKFKPSSHVFSAHEPEQSLKYLSRPRRTAEHLKVHRHLALDRARHGIAALEHATVAGTIANRDHQLWIGRHSDDIFQGSLHIHGD